MTRSGPAYQAFRLLHAGFTLLPLVAGLDKYFRLLTDWDRYLAPAFAARSPIGGRGLMMLVGLVEVLVGLLVAARPNAGGYVVALWLLAIVANLVLLQGYYDIALRDLGLALGGLALARLAVEYDKGAES